ncbi:MAG: DUF1501 domain-containing protein [Aureliella sp.]
MDRRNFLRSSAAACAAAQVGWRVSYGAEPAAAASGLPPFGAAEHCIFIWLGGGMAQVDSFDPKARGSSKERKPGTDYDVIDTAVSGVRITEHLRRTAARMDRVTAVRSVHHEMIDEHAAAVYWVHVGRPVSGTVQYPSIGSAVAHELGAADDSAPPYVVIGYPNVTRGPGFLGPKHGYLYLTDLKLGPRGLSRPDFVTPERQDRRLEMLATLRRSSLERLGSAKAVEEYDAALNENIRLAGNSFLPVFDLDRETAATRELYGSEFGQRCLLARRLTERGVRFVEVAHNLNFVNGTGWDTHKEGQQGQWVLLQELDQALAALIDDLEARKRLDKTLIVIGTEFGRPWDFDAAGGRGHQSTTFSLVLAGGGLKHCGAIGVTDEKSKSIIERPVSIPDFHATVHHALGIDCRTELYDGDRPVPITDRGTPIAELFS